MLDKKGTVFPSVGQLTINGAMIHVIHPYNLTVSRKITPSNPVALITHQTPVLKSCNNTNLKLSLKILDRPLGLQEFEVPRIF